MVKSSKDWAYLVHCDDMLRYPPIKVLNSAKLALLFRADRVIIGAEGLLNSKDFPTAIQVEGRKTAEADLLENGLVVPALRQGRSFEDLYEIQHEIDTANRCQDRAWAQFLDNTVAEILTYSEDEFRRLFKSYAEEHMGKNGYDETIKGLGLQEIAQSVLTDVLSYHDVEGKLRRTHYLRVAEQYREYYRSRIHLLATIPYHQALIDALNVDVVYPSEWRLLMDYGFIRYHYINQSLEDELQKLLKQTFADEKLMKVIMSLSGLNLNSMRESLRKLSAQNIKSIQDWSEYKAFIDSIKKDEVHTDSLEFLQIADNYFYRLSDYLRAVHSGTVIAEKRINWVLKSVQWGTLSLSLGRTLLSVLSGLDPIPLIALSGSLLSITLRTKVPKAIRRRRLKRALAATELNTP